MNSLHRFTFILWISSAFTCVAAPPIVIEVLDNYPGGGLGTMLYPVTPTEEPFLKSLTAEQQTPVAEKGSPYTMHGLVFRRTAWFGIVREVKENSEASVTELLVEMKYFNGLTDLHQQIVSINGAGDFKVRVPGIDHAIQRLSLIRVYGRVTSETNGIPLVEASYARLWPWGGFAFKDYGVDHSNPLWIIERKPVDRIYSSHPDKSYYEDRLGKRD